MESVMASNERFSIEKKFYNPGSFPILSPFFSFVLPAILYAINEGNAESKEKRNRLLIYAMVSGVVFFLAIFLVGDVMEKYCKNSAKMLFEGINIAVGSYLYSKQKKDFDEWKKANRTPKSIFIPIGISIIPIALLIAIIASNPLANNEIFEFGENVVSFPKSIEKEKVAKFSEALISNGILSKDAGVGILVKKKANAYEFYFAINPGYLNYARLRFIKSIVEKTINDEKIFDMPCVFVPCDDKWKEIVIN